MIGKLLHPELMQLIESRQFNRLREVLSEFGPADIAEILEDMESEEGKAVLLRVLPYQVAADVFEHLSSEEQELSLRALGKEKVAQILNEMNPDDRTAFFEELPSSATQQLLSLLSPDERRVAVQLLGYPEDSVGRRMTPEYVAIRKDWTVGEVLAHLRRVGRDRETLNQMFVLDPSGRLAGSVRLRHLVVEDLQTPIADLLEPATPTLSAADDQETAVAAFKKYDRTTLPVLDSQGVLVGVVTVDDVLDVVDEEATEDIHRGMAVEPLHTSLAKVGFGELYRGRVVWLVLLVFMNILSGAGIAYFEDLIESLVALVFFLPLLIGSGGNSGSQSATLVIRAMALGEIKIRDYLKVLFKELRVAIALGITMSAAVFMVAWWRSGSEVAVVVAISMVAVVFVGSLMGMSLPFVLGRLKLDPATASAPLVASLADIAGVLIYLGIAQALLTNV
jgi:magnesium transporter